MGPVRSLTPEVLLATFKGPHVPYIYPVASVAFEAFAST